MICEVLSHCIFRAKSNWKWYYSLVRTHSRVRTILWNKPVYFIDLFKVAQTRKTNIACQRRTCIAFSYKHFPKPINFNTSAIHLSLIWNWKSVEMVFFANCEYNPKFVPFPFSFRFWFCLSVPFSIPISSICCNEF